MITLKSPREIEGMRRAGAVLAGMHVALRDIIKPGITGWDIEMFSRKWIKDHHAVAEEMDFEGYKYATCVSINDEICHAIPRKHIVLKDGDLVKVDTVISVDGYMADSAWAFAVGTPNDEVKKLMAVTKKLSTLVLNKL